MKKIISTENAPKAIGPYSQAIESDNLVFVSGQLPIDPSTDEFAGDNIAEQTHQSLKNLTAILKECGLDLSSVAKTTVLLKNMSDFTAMNEVYSQYFKNDYPARICYEVSKLPKDALVEIDAIAIK